METKGREAIERATELAPDDPYMYYYRALIEVALGRTDQALDEIETAVARGYPKALVRAEPDFKRLQGLGRFGAILN
jgi:tetratricopeptide (TPR) repeat protein